MMDILLSTAYLPLNYAIRIAIYTSTTINQSMDTSKFITQKDPLREIFYSMLTYAIMTLFGYLNDFLQLFTNQKELEPTRQGYVQLYSSFENFYRRNIYARICECVGNPLVSLAGTKTTIAKRIKTKDEYSSSIYKNEMSGETFQVINFVSYNYLEMNTNCGTIAESVKHTIKEEGFAVGSPGAELGTTKSVLDLEKLVADFLNVESAIVVGQGFATNSTIIPAITNGQKCFILADELNHTSIAMGCKLSLTSTVARFRHNDMIDLESKLQEAVFSKRYDKILIIVEGIYSMEGTIVNLPEVIRLKTMYKAYLYVDEAHSIGALGPRGRGVTDHFGIDPKLVDILMGTFTKSFGASGGYVAGKKDIIERIRATCHAFTYACPMSPLIAEQISSVIKVIQSGDHDPTSIGRKKIEQLANNTKYFRERLSQLGFFIIGDKDSAVVPLLTFSPVKAYFMGVTLMKMGIGAQAVGFPATGLNKCRIRFCLSSGHTKEMMDIAIQKIIEVARIGDIYRSRSS